MATAAAGCSRGANSAGAGAATAAAPAAKPVPVSVAQVTSGEIARVLTAGGKIVAASEVAVASKLAGKVAEVRVQVGQAVSKGDVLVVLDNAELAAQVQQAEGGLAQAEANLANARLTFQRTETLFQQGAVSRQQFDQARFSLQAAEAQLKQARGAAALARANYENSIITAPVSGVIGSRGVEPGAFASPGVPLLTVVDMTPVYLETSVSENEVNKLALGSEVRVNIASLGEEGRLTGKIATLSPAADPKTKNFQLKVEIANRQGQMKPGMYGEVELVTERRQAAAIVPAEAVLDRDGLKLVFVVEGGRARQRTVQTGIANAEQIEILEGVTAGETVIVSGHQTLADGAAVLVKGGK